MYTRALDRRFVMAAIAIWSWSAGQLTAQEPLRWKFAKGSKFDYDMVQDMSIGSTGGPGGAQGVKFHQELKMTWNIDDVTKDGDAIIRQKIDSVKMKTELPPPVGAIEYDSTSKDPPSGPAAMLAPMYTAMIKGAFVLTMSPRGEIKDVKLPEEVIALLKSRNGAQADDMNSAESFKKLFSQGAFVLPEGAPKEGESWSTTIEVSNPVVGKQTVETTYKFVGTREVEGVTHAVFQPTVKVTGANEQVKISKQESAGEVLFNVAEGRLDSSQLEQKVTIEQPGGQSTIDQKITVTVKPEQKTSEATPEEKAATKETEAKK